MTDQERKIADLLALLAAVVGCSQAAPWLARMPYRDGNLWDAILKTLREG